MQAQMMNKQKTLLKVSFKKMISNVKVTVTNILTCFYY